METGHRSLPLAPLQILGGHQNARDTDPDFLESAVFLDRSWLPRAWIP